MGVTLPPMDRFRHILVATDFSEPAELAVNAVPQIEGGEGTRVTIAHVVATPTLSSGAVEQDAAALQELEVAIHEHLDRMREVLLPKIADVKTAILRSNNAADAICEFAVDSDVDLILLGTTGRTGVARFLIGSVAERVVRHAPCTVMVVRV